MLFPTSGLGLLGELALTAVVVFFQIAAVGQFDLTAKAAILA